MRIRALAVAATSVAALTARSEQLGPGAVPVFDDIQPAAQPGQRLCFIPMAQVGRPRKGQSGNDKGQACLTID